MGTEKILIVGGGLAGLSAAMTLQQNASIPQEITIVEARDRVGGRTHTVLVGSNFPGVAIDVGGQWVGALQSKVLGLISHFKLNLKEQYYPEKNSLTPTEDLVECVGYVNPTLDDQSIEEIRNCIKTIDLFQSQVDVTAPWLHPRAEVTLILTLIHKPDPHPNPILNPNPNRNLII